MDIELYSLLSTIILVSTIVTIIFAVFSYITFRARERRRNSQPRVTPRPEPAALKSTLFRKYERQQLR